jgi:DNA-binding NtrC family response regulator
MREHLGDLILENDNTTVGASFKLWIPLDAQFSDDVNDKTNSASESLHEGTTLIVDDEPEIADLLADILKSAGFTVAVATSGREALGWLEENHCDFVLSDIRMPGLDGPALWRKLQEKHPALVRRMAFVTGDTLSASITPFLKETGLPCLEKPFTPEQVLELMARIEAP